jgi:hypothetical protein
VEELDVVSDREVVERDSGEERCGFVGLAALEKHECEEAGAVCGCGRQLPQGRRFNKDEVFFGEQQFTAFVAYEPSPQLM